MVGRGTRSQLLLVVLLLAGAIGQAVADAAQPAAPPSDGAAKEACAVDANQPPGEAGDEMTAGAVAGDDMRTDRPDPCDDVCMGKGELCFGGDGEGREGKEGCQECIKCVEKMDAEHAGSQAAPPPSNGGWAGLGRTFLKEKAAEAGVVATGSGLMYKILESGPFTGATPRGDQPFRCHYTGTTFEGAVFDSSYERGEPEAFTVNQVIKGWSEAVQLMKEGDVWELYIPSELGYGAKGLAPDIPPNAALVFKLQLLAVKPLDGDDAAAAPDVAELPDKPGTSEQTRTVNVDGAPVKIDGLGPIVVNKDGTYSRITNWHGMSEAEQQKTLKIVGKRNKARVARLKMMEML